MRAAAPRRRLPCGAPKRHYDGLTVTPGRDRSRLNVLTNTAASIMAALAGLVIVPTLIKQLGSEVYGLWALISATTGYFALLDLGMSPAVGRLLAAARASGDLPRMKTVASSAAALASLVFLSICLAIWIVEFAFFLLFKVPLEHVADVKTALAITGFGVAVFMQSAVFTCLLWAYERFDMINAVDIPVLVLRTGLILYFIHNGSSLTDLALIVFATNIISCLAYAVLCWRVEPALSFAWRDVRRSTMARILNEGLQFAALNSARTLGSQVGVLVAGFTLSLSAVSTFAVAKQLASYANAFLVAAVQPALARGTALHFAGDIVTQRSMLLTGGRYAAGASFFFVGGLVLLGDHFISLWQSGRQEAAYIPLIILILGEALPMSQWVAFNLVLSAGRQRVLAGWSALEAVAALLSAAVLAGYAGVSGICLALAAVGTVSRGFMPAFMACRMLEVSIPSYLRKALLPILASAVAPCFVFHFFLRAWSDSVPLSWASMFLNAFVYATLSIVAVIPAFLISPEILVRVQRGKVTKSGDRSRSWLSRVFGW